MTDLGPSPVTWITGEDLATYLDQDYAAAGAAARARFDDRARAAGEWAFEERAKYGYVDDLDVVPSGRVREGALMYGSILLRDQGSYDGAVSFAEFAGMNTPTGGSKGQVEKLLGVPIMVIG